MADIWNTCKIFFKKPSNEPESLGQISAVDFLTKYLNSSHNYQSNGKQGRSEKLITMRNLREHDN